MTPAAKPSSGTAAVRVGQDSHRAGRTAVEYRWATTPGRRREAAEWSGKQACSTPAGLRKMGAGVREDLDAHYVRCSRSKVKGQDVEVARMGGGNISST